jgi:hypothetical protein
MVLSTKTFPYIGEIRPKIKIDVVPVTCWLKGRIGR